MTTEPATVYDYALHGNYHLAFLESYIETAVELSYDTLPDADDDAEPVAMRDVDANLSGDAWRAMEADCDRFIVENMELLIWLESIGFGAELAGADFWLTRNGHGAGFWDRGLGTVGELLTEAAKFFSESYLYFGDDGQIYVS